MRKSKFFGVVVAGLALFATLLVTAFVPVPPGAITITNTQPFPQFGTVLTANVGAGNAGSPTNYIQYTLTSGQILIGDLGSLFNGYDLILNQSGTATWNGTNFTSSGAIVATTTITGNGSGITNANASTVTSTTGVHAGSQIIDTAGSIYFPDAVFFLKPGVNTGNGYYHNGNLFFDSSGNLHGSAVNCDGPGDFFGNGFGLTNIPAWQVIGAVTNNAVVRYVDLLGNYVISNQVSGVTSIIGTNGEAPLTLLFANTNLMTSRGTVLAYDPTGTNLLINGASTNNIGGDQIYDEIQANTNATTIVLTNVVQDMTFVLDIEPTTNTTVYWSTNLGLIPFPSTNGLTQAGTYYSVAVASNQLMIFSYRTNFHGQFVEWAVNNQAYTFSGNGSGLTNLSLCYYTNLVNGQLYTNPLTVTMQLTIPVAVSSPAGTLGSAEIDAKTGPKGGTLTTIGDLDIAGGATSILATNKSVLVVNVPSGWTWETTNSTSGTGYVAGYDATKTNQVLIIP